MSETGFEQNYSSSSAAQGSQQNVSDSGVIALGSRKEVLAAIAEWPLELSFHLMGGADGARMFQGFIRGNGGQPVLDHSGRLLKVIFHEGDSQEIEQRLSYQIAAQRLSDLFGIADGAPPAAARQGVCFVDPFTGQVTVMNGWVEAVSGEELQRGLRMRAQKELGNSRSLTVALLIKKDRALCERIAEAIFFRLVLLCERDPSGRNFLITSDGRISSINISPGSAFTADRHCRFLLHPFFGNVMLRILEELSGKEVPSALQEKARDFLCRFGACQQGREELAAELGLATWQTESMMERLTEVLMTNEGRFPTAAPPEELQQFLSGSSGSRGQRKLSASIWAAIKGAFGI